MLRVRNNPQTRAWMVEASSYNLFTDLQVSHLPAENGEGMQVLHYVNGQKYEPHHDYFHDK